MYRRLLKLPDHSFFLFGPRGTGKTTWLKSVLPDAKWYNLIREAELYRLMRNPNLLRSEVEALAPGSWVVVDEVQRLPALLNEVHALIADHERTYRFALSGSSARKLKRLDANLLAGRAINRSFFPLTAAEMGDDFNADTAMKTGTLPAVVTDQSAAIDILEAYATNYLGQEIQQEALVHNIGSFSRFLEVAALMNGKVTNVSNIARDAGVARPTVQRYFDVLVATLLGVWLPSWRPRAKVKESGHPKFYFFDPGVVRALAGRLREPLDSSERGPLLETLVLHELRAYQNVANCGGTLHYWGTPSQQEIDFVWTRGERAVGMEIKSAAEWRRSSGAPLKGLLAAGSISSAFGVYLGASPLKDGSIDVLPIGDFLRRLNQGLVIG
jgi:predicted AAA+ superfamily ATPase